MDRSPSVALILEKENAVQEWRDLIGPTNPKEAQEKAPNRYKDRLFFNPIVFEQSTEQMRFRMDSMGQRLKSTLRLRQSTSFLT